MVRVNVKMVALAAVLAAGCGGTKSGSTGATTAGSGSTTGATAGVGANGTGSTGLAGSGSSGGTATTTAGNGTATTGASGSTTTTSATTTATTATTTSTAGNTGTTSGTTSAGTTATTTSGNGSTTGNCWPNGSSPGNNIPCCSGYVDPNGFCADPSATTSGTTSSGTTTSGTTSTNGGTTGGTCSESCYTARGYHCENGQCVLNGQTGPIQVTLEWPASMQTGGQRAREDLDLHVVDPSGCEIYYGNKICGAGTLDLDQNPACSNTDNAGGYGDDTENVIYDPNQTAPSGTYSVYVDDYEDSCDGASPSPFFWKVTIRAHGTTQVYQGQFQQGDADSSSTLAGAGNATGHKLFTFTY